MKKIYITMCSLAMAFLLVSPVSAKETTPIGISFEGNAKQFVLFQGNTTDTAFEDMMPGEQRTQTFIVRNDSYEKMKFYVKANQTEMLNTDSSSKRIVYDIDFKNNEETFFSGRIGTVQDKGKENLKENYLLKTLAKGESTTIDMSIKIDGTSMDNSYQGNIGDLGLVFSVEVDTGNPVVEIIKKIPVINKIPGVITGDYTTFTWMIAGLVTSVIVIVMILKKGKKEATNEN
ncbi:MAG: hypothetical protein RR585_04350 [Coprobacillus sp.]